MWTSQDHNNEKKKKKNFAQKAECTSIASITEPCRYLFVNSGSWLGYLRILTYISQDPKITSWRVQVQNKTWSIAPLLLSLSSDNLTDLEEHQYRVPEGTFRSEQKSNNNKKNLSWHHKNINDVKTFMSFTFKSGLIIFVNNQRSLAAATQKLERRPKRCLARKEASSK